MLALDSQTGSHFLCVKENDMSFKIDKKIYIPGLRKLNYDTRKFTYKEESGNLCHLFT